jgi:DNA-binding transcriptional regulator LsrR (DeoR family)
VARCRVTKKDVYRIVRLYPGITSAHIADHLGLFRDTLVSRYLGLLEKDGLVTADNTPTEEDGGYLEGG